MDHVMGWSSPLIVAVLLVFMFVANEVGYWLGRNSRRFETDSSKSVSQTLKTSIFGFVAFLLAFSFSLTSSRHDVRRRVVLDEANAIGTCYLRAGLLDNEDRTTIQRTLRQLAEKRLLYFQNATSEPEMEKAHREMNEISGRIWEGVQIAFNRDQSRVHSSQIIPAANAVIDLQSERAWTVRSHLQKIVLVLLIISVLVSNLLLGHSSGQVGVRHLGLWISFNILFALVLFVVLDYDRPRHGFIQVDHTPFVELIESFKSTSDSIPN